MKIWSLKGKDILIIDDFPGMRTMLKNMLAVYNANSITDAVNGEEAIKLISENQYDVILCDYNLGNGKDGQQVLEEAKERDLIPYSSIYIMTTAENTAEMVMGAVEYIPDDYLSKPFTKEVLIARLKRLVEKKENLREISQAIQQRDYLSAIDICEKLLDNKPKNRYELLKTQAELYIKVKDYDNAEAVVNAVLQEREIPWALLYLGQIHFHRGKYDEARYIFEDLSADNPNYLFAHDWLSIVHEKTGDLKNSQDALMRAIEKSPKAIKRQQSLASIAFKNQDLDTSEKAYKRIVRTGKHSCYFTPDDYSGLARVYIKKGMTADALNTLSSMKESFCLPNSDLNLKYYIHEAAIHNEMLNNEKTVSSLNKIMDIFEVSPGEMNSSDAIDIAEICYAHGMHDAGNKLSCHAIRNNHDNQEAIDEIITRLSASGLSIENIDTLMETRDEVVELNNRGVKLATNGNIQESISLFVKAAAAMAENKVINLNAAQSLIMFMKQAGPTHALLNETKKYLDRVSFDGKPSDKYRMLTKLYREQKKSADKQSSQS
ncbi:MAG: response regulator [Gammaproteobacteria bacterium]|nr:response regulator [Gammaproteobacteria bacterium]